MDSYESHLEGCVFTTIGAAPGGPQAGSTGGAGQQGRPRAFQAVQQQVQPLQRVLSAESEPSLREVVRPCVAKTLSEYKHSKLAHDANHRSTVHKDACASGRWAADPAHQQILQMNSCSMCACPVTGYLRAFTYGMQAAAANKKDAAMFSKMFKPSKEKPAAAELDAKENAAPAANGHDKADAVENAEAVLMETEDVTAGQGAADAADAEPVSAAAIK